MVRKHLGIYVFGNSRVLPTGNPLYLVEISVPFASVLYLVPRDSLLPKRDHGYEVDVSPASRPL